MIRVGEVSLSLRNLVKGGSPIGAKCTAEIEINGHVLNCILKEKVRGRFASLEKGIKEPMSVIFEKQRETKYTKNGYEVFLLTLDYSQLWIYIKREDVPDFYNAILVGESS